MRTATNAIAKVVGYSVEPFEYKDGFAIMGIKLFVPFNSVVGFKTFNPEAVVEMVHDLFENFEHGEDY